MIKFTFLTLPSVFQGIDLALACKEVGVKHLIYSGLESVKKSMGLPCPHFDSKADVVEFLQVKGLSDICSVD